MAAQGERGQGNAGEAAGIELPGAIQLAAVRARAAAAGIQPGTAAALLAPVPVSSVELGHVAGRTPADELAVTVMTGLLLLCISVFGSMVLTGVLEEKSSRVVEVLLARIPARALLAGKIASIGLLGLAQIGITALAAAGLLLVFALALSWAWTTLGLLLRTPQAVMSTGTIVLFPLTLASNVFVAPRTMPGWLQAFVHVNPVTHLVIAERALMAGQPAAGPGGLGAARLRGPGGGIRAGHRLALRPAAVSAQPGPLILHVSLICN